MAVLCLFDPAVRGALYSVWYNGHCCTSCHVHSKKEPDESTRKIQPHGGQRQSFFPLITIRSHYIHSLTHQLSSPTNSKLNRSVLPSSTTRRAMMTNGAKWWQERVCMTLRTQKSAACATASCTSGGWLLIIAV